MLAENYSAFEYWLNFHCCLTSAVEKFTQKLFTNHKNFIAKIVTKKEQNIIMKNNLIMMYH